MKTTSQLTQEGLEEYKNLFELNKEDRIFVKVSENTNNDNWLIGFGKDCETNKAYHIVTNNVYASELGFSSAKKDAELLCEIWNLILNGKFIKQKAFITSHTIKLLENMVEKLEAEMKRLFILVNNPTIDEDSRKHYYGMREAKQETITYLQEEIKKLKTMI